MSIFVVSGMQPENAIVAKLPGVRSFFGTGFVPEMVPSDCTGIVRLGVSGGLSPQLKIGDVVVGNKLVGKSGMSFPDLSWSVNITKAFNKALIPTSMWPVFSDPNVWVSDPARRSALYRSTGASFSDNESLSVAAAGAALKLPWAIIGAISDQSDSTVVNDPSEITASGKPNILVDIRDFIQHPIDIVHEAIGFDRALDALTNAVKVLGSGFAQ